MKIKDLERTVNVAWSPASQYPILLAAGTAAQQLDASFSTNACLELYSLNLTDPGLDMKLEASVASDYRFHKVAWGSYDNQAEHASGVIVGGCDAGLVQIYSASKLLKGEDCLISRQEKHTGPVHSMDFNPFQQNLLATGASESEIYIWDLNNTNTPMTPGSKSQPFEDVQCLSWNRQVQHILAASFSSRCVVWDLRKNEPIIKLTDTASHIRWKMVAWHPDVATQLCLASEEDQAPVIQLWDLRFATSPLKVLENHHRGILSVTWCTQDPDLLISCGKDNRILCWNPNSNAPRGEVLSEIAETIQWNFDVEWCPRNPALIAASSFDGHVSIYSLMGGKQEQIQTTNKIADSFPGMEGYVQAPVSQQAPVVSVDLAKAPKWLKKPVGASFGFGGKLITFENDKNLPAQTPQQPGQMPVAVRSVNISQVITEPELVEKSNELEHALQSGNYAEYCRVKADATKSQHDRYIWYFLKANFENDPKLELLNLLGYKPEDIDAKLNQYVQKSGNVSNDSVDHLTNQMSTIKYNSEENDDLYNDYKADMAGGYDPSSTFDAIAADNKFTEAKKESFTIGTGEDVDGLIAQALLLGNVEAAVEFCMDAKRMADALIIAMTGGSELLARTQYRYLQQCEGYVSALISALVSEDWSSVVNYCNVESWKEALAAVLTHCSKDEMPILCERLGERLENESNGNVKLLQDAQLCYICAGSFNKLVNSWSSNVSGCDPEKLQELVELVTFLQKAMEQQGRMVDVSGKLAKLLSNYAILLASQGNLDTALNYLGESDDQELSELRERLYYSLGHKQLYGRQRVSNARQSVSSYQNQQIPFSQTAQNSFNPTYPQYNTGLPNATPTQQWQRQNSISGPSVQPPKPFTPTPTVQPPQPARPSSVGSSHGGSGITGRSKYVVDPSVQSNPSYNTVRTPYANNPSAGSNMMPPAPSIPPLNPVPTYQPNLVPTFPPQGMQSPAPLVPTYPAPTQNFPTPNQNFPTPNQNFPTPNQNFPGPNQNFPGPNQNFPGPNQNFPGPNQNFPAPIQNQPTQNSGPGPYVNQPMSGNAFNNNVEVAQSALNAFGPPKSSPPGWNDPPAVSKSTRPQAKIGFTAPSPITHPLYGSAPETAPVNNGYENNQQNTYNASPMHQQRGQFPPPVQNYQTSVQNYQQPPAPQQNTTPQAPKPKEPIPEEHVYMQVVFDELKAECFRVANNPQTKRKIDDVARKLDALYDMLREQKLSATTLSSLHQMVQMVQVGDYAGGLALHTQLVSGPDFAQISSFMPGLKVLLQCALQLQLNQ